MHVDPAGQARAPQRWPVTPGGGVRPRLRPAASSLRLTVTNSTINGNAGGNAGGAIANDAGTAVITGSTLASDTAPGAVGGGISSYGILTVKKSTLASDSSSGGYGGGIHVLSGGVAGSVNIIQSTLSGDSAAVGGGLDISGTTATVTQSTLNGNSAGQGGAIEVEGSSAVHVLNSTLTREHRPPGTAAASRRSPAAPARCPTPRSRATPPGWTCPARMSR